MWKRNVADSSSRVSLTSRTISEQSGNGRAGSRLLSAGPRVSDQPGTNPRQSRVLATYLVGSLYWCYHLIMTAEVCYPKCCAAGQTVIAVYRKHLSSDGDVSCAAHPVRDRGAGVEIINRGGDAARMGPSTDRVRCHGGRVGLCATDATAQARLAALRGEMELGLPYCRSRIVGPFWRVLTIWLGG